jgi:phosphoglycolate phosphatase
VSHPFAVTEAAPLLADHVEHVIWDWNGTLLDDHAHCVTVINAMLRDEGLPETDAARARALFDFPIVTFYERLGFSLGGGSWERLAVRFIAEYQGGVDGCGLRAHVRAALRGLAARGRTSSILSAAHRASIEPLLDRHGIREYFTDVVALDNHYAGGKVEVGVAWMRARGLDPARTLLVGDTAHDHEVASAMGVGCVLVAGGHHARDRLEACGCPVVDGIDELV